jgi:cell division protein ZapA
MAQVTISVNGRPYTVACEDGQEPRLNELAVAFDKEVKALASAVGQVGDNRLLVIAGLSLIDRLNDESAASESASGSAADAAAALAAAEERAASAEERARAAEEKVSVSAARATSLERQLDAAAKRLDAMAERLEADA